LFGTVTVWKYVTPSPIITGEFELGKAVAAGPACFSVELFDHVEKFFKVKL
jgi:hypothetical protein